MKLTSPSFIYEIKQIISQNNLSIVCTAHRKNKLYPIGQKVLLKIFKKGSKIYPLELESLVRVHSDYCVKILNFELIDHKPSLILEWIHGVDLLSFLKKAHPLSSTQISCILWQIQQGLLDLNKQGLCHGDLSLSNVLIDSLGQIKLIDFGKGNYMGEHIFSTPLFTAPEVLESNNSHLSSDLFSLGVIEHCLKNFPETKKPACRLKDPLLDPNPEDRKPKAFVFQNTDKKILARRVKRILQESSIFKTRPLTPQTKRKHRPFFYFLLLSFMALTSAMKTAPQTGSLSIRSHQWFFIQIAGQSGFTPFSSKPLPVGDYLLRWKNNIKKGSLTITIEPGGHLLLTDQDLYPHK